MYTNPENKEKERENVLAALALGKTTAFILYQVIVYVIFMIVMLLLIGPDRKDMFPIIATIITLTVLESILLFLVIKGWLPGTRIEIPAHFSEKQMAVGFSILSGLTLLIFGFSIQGTIIRFVINGALILCTVVYFITKSILSNTIRLEVLAGAILPLAQFFIKFR